MQTADDQKREKFSPWQQESSILAPRARAWEEAAGVPTTTTTAAAGAGAGIGGALDDAVLEDVRHLGVRPAGDDAGVVLPGELFHLAPPRQPGRRRRQRRPLHGGEQRELGVPVLDAELDRRAREVPSSSSAAAAWSPTGRRRQLHPESHPEEHPAVVLAGAPLCLLLLLGHQHARQARGGRAAADANGPSAAVSPAGGAGSVPGQLGHGDGGGAHGGGVREEARERPRGEKPRRRPAGAGAGAAVGELGCGTRGCWGITTAAHCGGSSS